MTDLYQQIGDILLNYFDEINDAVIDELLTIVAGATSQSDALYELELTLNGIDVGLSDKFTEALMLLPKDGYGYLELDR